MTPKIQATKEKLDKFNFTKLNYFCILEDTIKKMKKIIHRM
jgi:hypothetical protein